MRRARPRVDVRTVDVDGQPLRAVITRGSGGTPLLICNGIGANLELLEPLTRALCPVETITFDVPGIGGSPLPRSPYRLSGLARLVAKMVKQLGYQAPIDVLGVSWGGTLAQQFARTCSPWCRRLVLVSTTPGVVAVPGSLTALFRMIDPRRTREPEYLRRVAPQLYGGAVRHDRELLDAHIARIRPVHWRSYLYQQLALTGWTSVHWLATLRQPTLVISGDDDPLVPLANARLFARLIPDSRLHVVEDGHLFLLTRPRQAAELVTGFLSEQPAGGR